MKKLKLITSLLLITLCLSIQAITFAETEYEANERDTAVENYDRQNQQSYQQLRDSLIPKQTEFIQKSKNLDIDGSIDVSEKEQKQIQFTEGNLETQILPRILKIIIYSSILIFTGLFIYAGIILVISNGDESTYTEVKNLIVNTLIGVGVILGSYALVYGIVTILQNLRT